MSVLLILAAHGGSGAAIRRLQAIRIAARAFEVILFDGQTAGVKTASLHICHPRPQAVFASALEPLALKPRSVGET